MIKVQINYDKEMEQDAAIIKVKEESTLVRDLSKFLTEYQKEALPLYKGVNLFVIPIKEIYLIQTDGSKLKAFTENEEFEMNYRLYELEDSLLGYGFIKVNSGQLVNFNKAMAFDFGEIGTIIIKLKNSLKCRVSRRRIQAIKKYLGV